MIAALIPVVIVLALLAYRACRRPARYGTAVPRVPAAPDNVRGTDAEAFGICHAIWHSGTARRRNTGRRPA